MIYIHHNSYTDSRDPYHKLYNPTTSFISYNCDIKTHKNPINLIEIVSQPLEDAPPKGVASFPEILRNVSYILCTTHRIESYEYPSYTYYRSSSGSKYRLPFV